jgi:hypothetical protein
MEMQRGIMALHHQAYRMLGAFRADLAARGLGFSPEDKGAIQESHAAHAVPEGFDPQAGPTAEQKAEMEATRQAAMNTVYPPEGLPEGDPRLAPIDGVSLPAMAMVAEAVGWSTDIEFRERICKALGLDRAAYDAASEEWRARLTTDMVVATLYGQLFAAVSGASEQSI